MNEPTAAPDAPVLDIAGLSVAYRQNGRWLEAVRDFSLQIAAGQTYGLVGESGSGKTTVALTVMRYLDQAGRVSGGHISFQGRDLLALERPAMRRVWGRELTLVPQDPLSSLNPSLPIEEQLAEGLRLHMGLDRDQARRRVRELLDMVRIPDPERMVQSYPHQLSGGMQQRVMIAMALMTEPSLLVLDEPTTALDVTTQADILDLFRDLVRQRDTATLYVTHNLGVVAQICDRVAVLYAGELVEDAATRDLFHRPLHPYTQGLIDSVPRLGENKRAVQLQAIPGQIPPLGSRPPACAYADRCPLVIDICHEERPPLDGPAPGHHVRCHRWPEIMAGEVSVEGQSLVAEEQPQAADDAPLLALNDVYVYFDVSRSLAEALARRPPRQVRAVDGVNLELPRRQTLGLVGESGSGKTTLARAIIGLEPISDGAVELLGVSLPSGLSQRTMETMRNLQIVFQNPEEALNPYLTVAQTLGRPLRRLRGVPREEVGEAVADLLAAVRLSPGYASRLPGQLSGGEKQRVALARAFAANPDLLIADEPVSSLDVSVQASILNLLAALQAEHGSAVLFISHDLAVVAYLADTIAVIYAGSLMEVADAQALLEPPYHPYTEALLSAIPLIDPDAEQEQIRLQGDVTSQIDVPGGCPFHPRCPRFLGDICVEQTPPWRVTESGDRIFCHIPLQELQEEQDRVFRFSQ
ncbi:MAG TPA: ABC transporter ATP-binding protein [Candidatus Sulfomarinibacteraceae bacterium]|nr:ABC transporter ATP-binding protein [Candidatus Sulfomarinibacteraceae bacterium]